MPETRPAGETRTLVAMRQAGARVLTLMNRAHQLRGELSDVRRQLASAMDRYDALVQQAVRNGRRNG